VVAVTIVPMLASRLLASTQRVRERQFYDRVARYYRGVITYSLGHRGLVVGSAFGIFVISIALMGLARQEYLPRLDEIYTTCVLKLAPGTSLEETCKFVSRVEQSIVKQPEFRAIISLTGISDTSKFDLASGAGPAGVNESELFFEIAPRSERDRTSIQFIEDVISGLPELAEGSCYFMQTTDYFTRGGERPIEVHLCGNDLWALKDLSDRLEQFLKKTDGIVEVDKSLRLGNPELKIDVDREKASLLGLTAGQVADTVDAAFLGRKVTKYREAGDEYDIRVRLSEHNRQTIENLQHITITSPLGLQVNLADIAAVREGKGPIEIKRENQQRVATVSANYLPDRRDLAGVKKEIERYFRENPLPEGYSYRYGGSIEDLGEMATTMLWVMILIILLVYMVMAAQFESLAHPLSIMVTVPLAFIGVALGLLLTGTSLSVMAYIGIMMLIGIVVNNGIVMIDYINQLRARGMAKDEAIALAVGLRLRPILMTSLTTCFGAIPMALSRGEGAELFVPIAITILGGLLTSTFLTLVILPSVYSLVDAGRERISAFVHNLLR
jgi:HAE1 family hydrophobic/amphiphilic exporter-1